MKYFRSSCLKSHFTLVVATILLLAPPDTPDFCTNASPLRSKSRCLLCSFQEQGGTNSTLLLVTKSQQYIVLPDVYALDSLEDQNYYDIADPVIGCYAYGLWLFYSEPMYNWDADVGSMIPGSRVEWILSTDRTIFYPFSMDVKSLRTAAGYIPISEPTFTVFLGHNYTGPSDVETDSNYANPPYSKPKSLIITGSHPWYVYTASNFVQKTVCLVSTNNHLLIGDFYAHQVTKLLRHINSAHIDGCSVEFFNAESTGSRRQARITNVRNESGQNVNIRRIPPIFMSNAEDKNKVNH